jgi:peptide methionine sulfoxide reductase MsrA
MDEQQKETALTTIAEIEASGLWPGPVVTEINPEEPFWQAEPDADGRFSYKNEIPWEIVEIFEKHGFIWGGKWYHYDTMHFEYRPEIILSAD